VTKYDRYNRSAKGQARTRRYRESPHGRLVLYMQGVRRQTREMLRDVA
jgi:hypothetical protein